MPKAQFLFRGWVENINVCESGNEFTKLMHECTLKEINSSREFNGKHVNKILPEKEVTLTKKGMRKGSFDFFLETEEGTTIGMEILTRPSKGKLRQKLFYAHEADEYVFVLPKDAIEDYRKRDKVFRHLTRQKFLPKEFDNPKLHVWLFDRNSRKIIAKLPLAGLFNVQRQR
ncbi:MAG: hypothetical protein NUV67_00060 [archaeon]|nr:hypothetical protein [archaeon]